MPSLNFPLHTYTHISISHTHTCTHPMHRHTCTMLADMCAHVFTEKDTQTSTTHTHTHTVVRGVTSLQSCSILCDPMGCGPPGSSVHGILQASILEWVAMPSSRKHTYTWIQSYTLLLLRYLFLGERKACGLGPNDQIL